MEILQVKQYHKQIAEAKRQKALEYWRQKDTGYGYPVKAMFYFMLLDNKGYNIAERKRGYIAFDKNRAVFGMKEKEAIEKFNQ